MPTRPERPADNDYCERERVELVSQGDLFRDVLLAYPMLASEFIIDEEESRGSRRFLSGPLEFGCMEHFWSERTPRTRAKVRSVLHTGEGWSG